MLLHYYDAYLNYLETGNAPEGLPEGLPGDQPDDQFGGQHGDVLQDSENKIEN